MTMPNKARVAAVAANGSSSSSARSIRSSRVRVGQVPSRRQASRISCASSLAGIFANQQLQLLPGLRRNGGPVRNDSVFQGRAAFAGTLAGHLLHQLPDQPAGILRVLGKVLNDLIDGHGIVLL